MNSQNRHYNFREINMQPLRSSVLLWFAHMFEHFCGKTHVFRPIRFMGGVFFPLISVIKIHVRKTCFFFRIIFLSPAIQSAWLVASWASQNSCWIFAYPKENLMHKTLLYQKTVGFLCLCFFHCYSVFVGIILWSFVLCCFRPSQKVVCVKRPFKASELLKLARMPIQHYWCPSSGLNCMMQVIIWMLRWTIQTRSADGNCNRFWCRLLPCLQNIVRMIS